MPQHATKLTDADFKALALGSSVPALVECTGADCPPCRLLEPIVDRLAGRYGDALFVGVIDVDVNRKTADAYEIDHIPVLLFVSGGEVVHRTTGFRSEKQLIALIHDKLGVPEP